MKNWLEKQFHMSEYGTNVKTELIAGLTTFVTMAYVLATVPSILAGAGLDQNVMFTAMIFLIILTTCAMALYTNRPFALAPGLGSVGIVASMISSEGISAPVAAGVIFWSGVLFIAISSPGVIVAIIGFVVILVIKTRNIPGGMILAILITTVIGIPFGVTELPSSFLSLPTGLGSQFMQIDFLGALHFAYIPFLIALFIPDFFSTFGTVLGVGAQAGYLDEDGNLPGIDKCFKVDAIATSFGALFCMPSMTTYLESSAGVEAGGKTGLTVIFTSIFFGLSLFLSPIALIIPSAATGPILIFIGINMLGNMRKIHYEDITEAVPAFVCIAFTIFANNIANGICAAIPAYFIMKIAAGKIKELSPVTYIMVAVCLLYFYTLI